VYVTATPLAEVDGETVPQSVASHCTTHVTPLFVGSLLTVAANRTAVAANTSTGPGGSMAMVTAETVTVEEAVAAALLTEVAVSVTPKLEARGAGGAAYVVGLPLAVAAGDTVPQGAAEQDTVHATPRLAVSLLTVAATCTLAPGSRVPNPVRGG